MNNTVLTTCLAYFEIGRNATRVARQSSSFSSACNFFSTASGCAGRAVSPRPRDRHPRPLAIITIVCGNGSRSDRGQLCPRSLGLGKTRPTYAISRRYDLAFALSCDHSLIQGQNEFSRDGV